MPTLLHSLQCLGWGPLLHSCMRATPQQPHPSPSVAEMASPQPHVGFPIRSLVELQGVVLQHVKYQK